MGTTGVKAYERVRATGDPLVSVLVLTTLVADGACGLERRVRRRKGVSPLFSDPHCVRPGE